MSRVAVASVAFTAALLNFLPLPAQTALTIHGHPQKASYASSADWPFISGQGHWQPANPQGTVGHTHVECTAPLYAELPRTSTLTLACRLQLFHVAGHIASVSGPLVSQVVWETPGPMNGDPMGVVLRNITVTFNPALSDPNNPPQSVPENGWYINMLQARTQFDDGAITNLELFLPFYAKGDPSVPEESGRHIRLGAQSCTFTPHSVFSGHGCPVSEYTDSYVPVAPVTSALSVPASVASYQLIEGFPGAGLMKQVNNADLHNGVPGTTIQQQTDPDPRHAIFADVLFDPAQMVTGLNKVALIWEQCTGAGSANPQFAAGECASSLLVVHVMKGGGGPGPQPVDCAGVKSWLEFSPGLWHQVFTVTQQPANGGKSCAVVVNGG